MSCPAVSNPVDSQEIVPAAAVGRSAAFKPHRSSNSARSTKQASSNYHDLRAG